MGDPSPRRPRKAVNYRAFMGGSDSEDDDFKERPSSSKSSKLATKNRLKLVGGNKENSTIKASDSHSKLPSSSKSPQPKHIDSSKITIQTSKSPKRTEIGDASVIIPEPDLSVHGISSQETVLMVSSSESVGSEKPDAETSSKPGNPKLPQSGKKRNNRQGSKYKNLSESDEEPSSSCSSDWGDEVAKKRKKKDDLKKRKLSTNSNKNENKKIKVDCEVKAKSSTKTSTNPSAKPNPDPHIEKPVVNSSISSQHMACSETTAVLVLSVEDSVSTKAVEAKTQVVSQEVKVTSVTNRAESSKEKSTNINTSVSKTNSRIAKAADSEKRDLPGKEEKPKEAPAPVRVAEKNPAVKMPVWNPPGKVSNSSKISNASPSTGLRLGLSRHGRFKPLHKTNALS